MEQLEKTPEEEAADEHRRTLQRRWLIRIRSDPKRYAEYKQRRAERKARSARRKPKKLPRPRNPLGIRLSSSWLVGGDDGPIPREL